MSLIAGRGCRWPPRRDSVSPCAPLSGGRDTHDGHENSPILVFFSNLLEPVVASYEDRVFERGDEMSLRKSRGFRWLESLGAMLLSGLMTSCGTADQPASQVEQPAS